MFYKSERGGNASTLKRGDSNAINWMNDETCVEQLTKLFLSFLFIFFFVDG